MRYSVVVDDINPLGKPNIQDGEEKADDTVMPETASAARYDVRNGPGSTRRELRPWKPHLRQPFSGQLAGGKRWYCRLLLPRRCRVRGFSGFGTLRQKGRGTYRESVGDPRYLFRVETVSPDRSAMYRFSPAKANR